MPTFAIIAEGPTDQVVIERLIHLIHGEQFADEIEVVYIQPYLDETDSSRFSFGGWELVLERCRSDLDAVLYANDYLIIHLDTDICDHANFGVSLTENGADRPDEELISDVCSVVRNCISNNHDENILEGICFAIAVHSIESWLLAIISGKDDRKNSYERLCRHLSRKNEGLPQKTPKDYETLARRIKKKDLLRSRGVSLSLDRFSSRLNDLVINRNVQNGS